MRAVVTGAGGGIGRAIGLVLTEEARERGEPSQLCLVDMAPDSLAKVGAELEAAGAQVVTAVENLSDPAAGQRIADLAQRSFGGLDSVVSNAGMFGDTMLLDLTVEQFDLQFAVNTRATWLLAKACHPMLKASRGTIVATASLSATNPTPKTGVYNSTKAALVMLIQQMAGEWGPDGIRCNCVSPGSTHTPMTAAIYDREGELERRGRLVPIGRIGVGEDIARVIGFLAGPRSAYVTGVNIPVDGGLQLSLFPHFWQLAAANAAADKA